MFLILAPPRGRTVPRRGVHSLRTSALAGCKWLASRSRRLTTGTHCIGSWVGPRACLDTVVTNNTQVSYGNRSLQNPTPGFLIAEVGNILARRTGLWSTEGIVPKAAWHWDSDSSAANGTSGQHALHPRGAGDCLTPWFLWDSYGPQESYRTKKKNKIK
jgi:hypothetical protein